jgi:hypothetical protein
MIFQKFGRHMEKFVIKKVRRNNFFGLENPFQSKNQFLSFLLFVTIPILTEIALVKYFAPHAKVYGIALGAVLCAFPLLKATLPSQLIIDCYPQSSEYWLKEAIGWIAFFGYTQQVEKKGNYQRFRTNQRKFLRWRENEIAIEPIDLSGKAGIVVTGPAAIIILLKNKLIKTKI